MLAAMEAANEASYGLTFAQLFSADLKLDRSQWEGRPASSTHYMEVDALVSAKTEIAIGGLLNLILGSWACSLCS